MPKTNVKKSRSKRPKGYFDEHGYDPDKFRTTGKSDESRLQQIDIVKPKAGIKKRTMSLKSIVFVIGIILIVSSSVFALNSLNNGDSRSLQDTNEYKIFQSVLESSKLNYESGPPGNYFDSGKLMALTGGELKSELSLEDNSFDDYEFAIEITDISRYPVHYNRTFAEGNAIETSPLGTQEPNDDITTFETGVNIYVGPHEIHTARLIMYVWKG